MRKSIKRGGSPASTRVMNLLPGNCNLAKNVPLTPNTNQDISSLKLYATTGGAKRRVRRRRTLRKRTKRAKRSLRKSRRSSRR